MNEIGIEYAELRYRSIKEYYWMRLGNRGGAD